MESIDTLAVVALLVDAPDKGLVRGQVGTVVEMLGPGAVEVEFSDEEGKSYATAALNTINLIVLHHSPVRQFA